MPGSDTKRTTFERGGSEFDRALTFFDAAFAVALTFLATTIDGASDPKTWESLSTLNDSLGAQLLPFAISFAVISVFWYGHHRFVAQLRALDGAMIAGSLALVATVVVLPFSTEAIGNPATSDLPLPVAVYAVNIAAISTMLTVLYLAAVRKGLLRRQPSRAEVRARAISAMTPAVVFLATIPLAYAFSPSTAEYAWLSLIVLSPLVGKRAERATALADQVDDDSSLDSGGGR